MKKSEIILKKDEVIKLRKEGMTYQQISEKVKLSKVTISKYCRSIKENFSIYEKIRKISDDVIIEAQKIYDDGHSLREVEKIIGVTRQSLSNHLILRNRKWKSEEETKKDNVIYAKKWKKKLRKELLVMKGGKCIICGYDKSDRALHFHHVDPDKKDLTIGHWGSKDLIFKEVEKCILVCSNCHCEIHDEIYQHGKSNIVEKLKIFDPLLFNI